MKKILLIGVALFLIIGMCAFAGGGKAASGGAPSQIRMATGGTTGTYYAFGTAISQIFTEAIKIPVVVQSSGASKANIQMMAAGDIEMALVQNDVMDYAYKGTDLFNGEKTSDFYAMAAVYAEACQIVASARSGIKSVADLKGKNVSVGDAGSGTEFNSRQILEAYGITFNDINKQNLGFGPSADALKDNKIDAFFCVAGAPTPAIVDLAVTNDIVVLEVDNASAAKLKQNYPFYSTISLPANSYKGQTSAIQILAIKATFIVSKKMPDDIVYQLTKTFFEKKPQIAAAHVKGNEIAPAYAVDGISVPFHPGAAKYLKEIGAIR